MKRIDLIKVEHNVKMGDKCPPYPPNITEDCIFYEDGQPIGFYIKKISPKMRKLADLADVEVRSNRVPKNTTERRPVDGIDETTGKYKYKNVVKQYSTIIGFIPPKAHMKRPYASISSVHQVKSAQIFIKAMYLLALESAKLIKEVLPQQYQKQTEIFKQVPDKWKFGGLWTSSITNCNISADFHKDNANIVGTVNAIITKRQNAIGGNLHIPDYNATIDSVDNSILVYPAWKNIHGVTPIEATAKNGYRNSLVFYPLKAFVNMS